jgi:hypothetical protein
MASEELKIRITKRKAPIGGGMVQLALSCTRDIEYEDGIASVYDGFDPDDSSPEDIENDPEYVKLMAVVASAVKRFVLLKLN